MFLVFIKMLILCAIFSTGKYISDEYFPAYDGSQYYAGAAATAVALAALTLLDTVL